MHADGRRFRERLVSSASICVHLRLIIILVAAAGCQSTSDHATTRPVSMYDRQEAALEDPFGYSPNMDKREDISGGKIGELDRGAMKKDIDHVLNP